ncbi:hypothetical protein DFJ73DRAFT_279440 [Zopfochytrium polystomum]|nr:hypothetical protein DFJ73DRAFT_279440 [Zopfochytrium polystomum]
MYIQCGTSKTSKFQIDVPQIYFVRAYVRPWNLLKQSNFCIDNRIQKVRKRKKERFDKAMDLADLRRRAALSRGKKSRPREDAIAGAEKEDGEISDGDDTPAGSAAKPAVATLGRQNDALASLRSDSSIGDIQPTYAAPSWPSIVTAAPLTGHVAPVALPLLAPISTLPLGTQMGSLAPLSQGLNAPEAGQAYPPFLPAASVPPPPASADFSGNLFAVLGPGFYPLMELSTMPEDAQFLSLVNKPDAFLEVKRLIRAMVEAGVPVSVLFESGLSPAVIIASADEEGLLNCADLNSTPIQPSTSSRPPLYPQANFDPNCTNASTPIDFVKANDQNLGDKPFENCGDNQLNGGPQDGGFESALEAAEHAEQWLENASRASRSSDVSNKSKSEPKSQTLAWQELQAQNGSTPASPALDGNSPPLFSSSSTDAPNYSTDTADSAPVMEASSGGSLLALKIKVNRTNHTGTGRRNRPSAFQLNAWSSSKSDNKPFVPAKSDSIIIDLSDSDGTDEEGAKSAKLDPNQRKDAEMRTLEDEIQRLTALIKEKQRTLNVPVKGTAANGGFDLPSGDANSQATTLSSTFLIKEMQQRTLNVQMKGAAANRGLDVPSGDSNSQVGTLSSHTPSPSTSSPRPAETSAKLPAVNIRMGNDAAGAMSLQKEPTQFEAEILADEKLLSSAKSDVDAKGKMVESLSHSLEDIVQSIKSIEKDIEDRQAQLATLEEEVSKTKKLLESAKEQLREKMKSKEHTTASITSLKKALLLKGNVLTELSAALNLKRKKLLDRSGTVSNVVAGSHSPKAEKRKTAEQSKPDQNAPKRQKLTTGGPGLVPRSSLRATTKVLDDVIALPKVDEPPEKRAAESNPTEALQSIPWERNENVEYLQLLSSTFHRPSLLCNLHDLYRSVFMQTRKIAPEKEMQNDTKSGSDIAIVPFTNYESPLRSFRSYRFSDSVMKKGVEAVNSTTFSNKIDFRKKMCMYEMQGVACNDESCTSQHFRTVKLSEPELLADLLKYVKVEDENLASALGDAIHSSQTKGVPFDKILKLIQETRGSWLNDKTRVVSMNRLPTKTPKETIFGESIDGGTTPARRIDPSTELIPPNHRILLRGLSKLLRGEEVQSGRYYEVTSTDDEYEGLLKKSPDNIGLWVNYAAASLPSPLTTESLTKMSTNLNKALHILSRALQFNRDSETLWNFYLELFVRRGAVREIREVFEQAIGFLPLSADLWWRYLVWEEDSYKLDILQRMQRVFTKDCNTIDPERRSLVLTSIILSITDMRLQDAGVQSAVTFLRNFLYDSFVCAEDEYPPIAETQAQKLLTEYDLAFVWLCLLCLLHLESLPVRVFRQYPFSFLANNTLFVIKYSQAKSPPNDIFGLLKHLALETAWSCANIRAALLANLLEFKVARMEETDQIVALIVKEGNESYPVLDALMSLSDEKVLSKLLFENKACSMRIGLWNRLVRLFLERETNAREIALCLTNAVRIFHGVPAVEADNSSFEELLEEGSRLYEAAISNHPLPPLSSFLRSSVHFWINLLLLESLKESAKPASLSVKLQTALEQVLDRGSRLQLWRQAIGLSLFSHDIRAQSTRSIHSAMARILHEDLSMVHVASSTDAEIDFMQPLPPKDHFDLSELLKFALQCLPEDQRTDLIDFVVRTSPDLAGFSPCAPRQFLPNVFQAGEIPI